MTQARPWAEYGWLEAGRCAWRGETRGFGESRNNSIEHYQAVDYRRNRHGQGRSGYRGPCRGAHRTQVRGRRVGAQVRTTMQLRPEKDDPKEYS